MPPPSRAASKTFEEELKDVVPLVRSLAAPRHGPIRAVATGVLEALVRAGGGTPAEHPCARCGRRGGSNFLCPRCSLTWYCSEACQEAGFGEHERDCVGASENSASSLGGGGAAADETSGWSVSELRRRLTLCGVNFSHCIERSDLVDLYHAVTAAGSVQGLQPPRATAAWGGGAGGGAGGAGGGGAGARVVPAALRPIVARMSSADEVVVASALFDLAGLMEHSDDTRVSVRDAGLLPQIVRALVGASGLPLKCAAANALSMAAYRHVPNKLAICDAGGIPPLVALLKSSREEAQQAASHALGNIYARTR
jgi:hypothetical protein